jgi:hypothetical protein
MFARPARRLLRRPSNRRVATVACLAPLLLAGCGGGGHGSGNHYSARGRLLSIEFPDPSHVNAEPENSPPSAAPLLQQIVFTFSANPDPDVISANSIQIRDANGFSVSGSFSCRDDQVTFTPQLPTRSATTSGNGTIDTGGTGLQPGSAYTVRVGPHTLSFVSSVDASLLARFRDPANADGIVLGFLTTSDPALFFRGPPEVAPALVSVDPVDGTVGVSPNLLTDPDGVFPPRRSFTLTFDAGVSPDLGNVSDATFRLVDLDHLPGPIELGVDVEVTENVVDHAVVQVTPSGILPFAHQLALEFPTDLHGIAQTGLLSGNSQVAATFTTADGPASVNDTIVENFDANTKQETDPAQLGTGVLPADWNKEGSGVLTAAVGFQGDGLLGRFVPPPPATGDTKVIVLDTTSQPFPLFDGSTPDAPVFTVNGGVFNFTDIDIPGGVVIQPLGSNPLVLTATGSVRIAGTIYVNGQDGNADNAYDSAVTSVPGGAAICGGGRGGEGHPILFYPTDQISTSNLVSPPYGGQGFGVDPADGVMKRIGGTGGQSGMVDNPDANGNYSTDHEPADGSYEYCQEIDRGNPGVKVPGGGGGSMYLLGHRPGDTDGGYAGKLKNGIGNVLVDGQGHYTIRDISDKKLDCGVPGNWPFYNDGNGLNDFFGTHGQLTRLIGGEGGGAGASNVEAYYCGIWCMHDSDPSNDAVCNAYDFGTSGKFADSVGDARGGGGGGGGGAVQIQALGSIELAAGALIDAHGGDGKGGEAIGCSNFGGGGGGGAGGMVILQSATGIQIDAGAIINVEEGGGERADDFDSYEVSCSGGGSDGAMGDGGPGGQGFIQLQVPAGQTATVVDADGSFPRRRNKYDPSPWLDPSNTLNPVEFTPASTAISRWYDFGRMIARAPGATPSFSFSGLDANGLVQTDADGNVLDPAGTDVVCDYLGQIDPITRQYKPGQEPKADFIPPNATIKVEFQGANAIAEGSKEADPASFTNWSASPSIADGMQFIRWRISFDLTANTSDPLGPDTPRPTVQSIQIPAQF